ncbi:MAG: CHAT domain-containing protein, partial [Planctomycetota bacterium]
LNSLAFLYVSMGAYAQAEPLYRQAREILKKALGEEHPDYAHSLNNLAGLYVSMGAYARAEPLYRQALEIRKKALGEEHPDYAQILHNLAGLYESMGKYAQAEPLFRQAREILKKALGEEHPDYAHSLNSLAFLYWSMGAYARAEPLYQQVRVIYGTALGEEHPDYAKSLGNLAALYQTMGAYARAMPLMREALGIFRNVLDATFAVQSERQQLQMTRLFRGTLDGYVSLSALAEVGAAETYAPVLAWKGAVFARQAQARLMAQDPKVASLFAEFERTSRQLATLCLSRPKPAQQEARRRKITELTAKREELERELSLKSKGYREVRAVKRLAPSGLQKALPAGVVLVDFLEYSRPVRADEGERSERHLVAFVVPAKGAIQRVEFGRVAPIAAAIDAWRASLPRRGHVEHGRKLRQLVWEPLAKHLSGVRTVLVSPDGALTRLAFAALPGQESGTHLIDEVSVAVLPVPQHLPSLLAHEAVQEDRGSLLLIGDVDYGGSAGGAVEATIGRSAAGTRTGERRAFGHLKGTRAEIAAIGGSFELRHAEGTVEVLRGGAATERAFRSRAPRCRWLHVATHGFFAPPTVRSALTGEGGRETWERAPVGYHPGLLSGLALAGANTHPEPEADDGILTALEVAGLDLSNVELAVLSACETGLGEVAGGEGVLGLQRAFQVSGARTTVTSLWRVRDEATQLLMQRFYENLWAKGMPKLEALRQAQLWLMREGGKPGSGVVRGVQREGRASVGEDGRLPPYYWAA